MIVDIGTKGVHVYTNAHGLAVAEVPASRPNPEHAARRALFLYLARQEQKSGETIIEARARMREYLRETPPVEVEGGNHRGVVTRVWTEAP